MCPNSSAHFGKLSLPVIIHFQGSLWTGIDFRAWQFIPASASLHQHSLTVSEASWERKMWPLQAGPLERLWEQGKREQAKFSSSVQREDKTLASYLVPVKIQTTFPVIYRSSGIMKYPDKKVYRGEMLTFNEGLQNHCLISILHPTQDIGTIINPFSRWGNRDWGRLRDSHRLTNDF